MNFEEHAQHLGSLVAHLHSLEFILRAYLCGQKGPKAVGLPHGADIYSLPVGVEVPESDLTSYDTLERLIKKVNASMTSRVLTGLDLDIVTLRDAIAHGRVSAAEGDGHQRLLKFEKPVGGKARISFNEVMDLAWFKSNNRKVYDALMHVHKHLAP